METILRLIPGIHVVSGTGDLIGLGCLSAMGDIVNEDHFSGLVDQ
jgi:hypothetical protein